MQSKINNSDLLAIWQRELDPTPILNNPFMRPGYTLMAVADKLGAVQNLLSSHAEQGLIIAGMAVDFTFSVLDFLGFESNDGPTPPLTNLGMACLAITNLRAVVRGHLEAWQRAAEDAAEPDAANPMQAESEAVVLMQGEAEAAPASQDEADVDAPTHDDESEAAAPKQDLEIDDEMFTIYYKGKPCELGNTVGFRLFVRLAESRIPVSHHALAEEVWDDDQTSTWAIYTQVKLLKKKLRAAGIHGIVIDGSITGHYRLILG